MLSVGSLLALAYRVKLHHLRVVEVGSFVSFPVLNRGLNDKGLMCSAFNAFTFQIEGLGTCGL